jgi:hypothetical protein
MVSEKQVEISISDNEQYRMLWTILIRKKIPVIIKIIPDIMLRYVVAFINPLLASLNSQ